MDVRHVADAGQKAQDRDVLHPAAPDNPYGASKRKGEEALIAFARETGAPVSIYRLKNVFGKWCRPHYNSVTATFCHNIAHDLPIAISDPGNVVDLIYIDDIVEAFLQERRAPKPCGGGLRCKGYGEHD